MASYSHLDDIAADLADDIEMRGLACAMIARLWRSLKSLREVRLERLNNNGAEGETRTLTTKGHRILNPTRLPVPPPRHGERGLYK